MVNLLSAYIDGSAIYGMNLQIGQELRTFSSGMFYLLELFKTHKGIKVLLFEHHCYLINFSLTIIYILRSLVIKEIKKLIKR